MKPFKIVLSFVFFIFSVVAYSQSRNFINYSVAEGLPFAQVFTIYQDSKGYLWSGGYGGLSRFDGYSFNNYSPKNGLADYHVTAITENDSGHLMIGTYQGLSFFNGTSFKTFTKKNGLADDVINALLKTKSGDIWICTRNGINLYNNKTFALFSPTDKFPSYNYLCAVEDNHGNVWFGTENSLVKYDGKKFSRFTVADGLCDNWITAIEKGNKDTLWLGTQNGLCVYTGKEFVSLYKLNEGPGRNTIRSLTTDSRGNLWVGTNDGLYKYDKSYFFKYAYRSQETNNNVPSVYLDKEDNLWIGTHSGLYKYRSDAFISYNEKDGLHNTFVYSIVKDKNGDLWIGTDGGGAYRFNGKKFQYYNSKSGLPDDHVNVIINSSNYNLLFGTNNGLGSYNNNSFIKLSGKNNLPDIPTHALYYDSKNVLWVGAGKQLYKQVDKNFELVATLTNSDAQIYGLCEDNNGTLWIGAYNGGLWNLKEGKLILSSQLVAQKTSSFFTILKDNKGNIFFSSLEGIHILNNGKTTTINKSNGLISELVYSIYLDTTTSEKMLWIGSNQGLSKLNLSKYYATREINIVHFGKDEGFTGVECNTNGIYKDESNNVWFGTVNGLLRYKPDEIIPNKSEAKIHITKILLNYSDTVLSNGVQLDPGSTDITFEFTGICLTNPSKVTYSFMLEGYDKGWSPEKFEKQARYSNLFPGTYTFKVKCKNNEGIWNTLPATFVFTIKTPFYKTTWFRVLLILLFAAAGVAIFKWRLNIIEKNESNKTLLSNLEMKALRSQMNPHFIFNALNSIQHFIMNHDADGASKYLNKFAKLIRSILNNSEKGVVSLKDELTSLQLYIELEAMRFENKFDFEIKNNTGIDASLYEIPAMVIQPYVENAILHGIVPSLKKGFLSVTVSIENNYIVCCIKDNGIGRAKSMELNNAKATKKHKSLGMRITNDRLELLNRIHNSNLNVNITDLYDNDKNASGTQVDIFIPLS